MSDAPLQHSRHRLPSGAKPRRCSYERPCAPRRIPLTIAEACYREWYHPQWPGQSLQRLNERGGFGCTELDMWNPKWRELLTDPMNLTVTG